MTIFQAIILGIVQGLTEFIPISSSAHLIIIPWIFHWDDPGLSFDISLHLGTLVALIWFFASDWLRYIQAGIASISERKIGNNPERRLAWLLLIACIPGGLAGLFLENTIESLFHQTNAQVSNQAMVAMAIIIIILGLALYIAERLTTRKKYLHDLSLKDALIVGFAQALAIFPGVSRSGSTITGGLYTGLKRPDAARFSFLLATPMIAGAGIFSLINITNDIKSGSMLFSELPVFALGFIAATLSGYLCIKLLLRFLQTNTTDIFVYYRWLLALFIIGVAISRMN